MTIQLDEDARARVAARIGARQRKTHRHRDDIVCWNMAERGWAPDMIAERFGRTPQWALEMLHKSCVHSVAELHQKLR